MTTAGGFIHEAAGIPTIVLLAVIAMIYVTLARGQLLGSSVLIDKRHFPEIFAVVERCSAMLGVPVPLVFVRDDIQVPVVALGFGEPYSLVISSHWLKHFEPDELTFMIGRELGNIAAGHTRLTSLLSVNGRENALIAMIFGAWLRRTEYTADRFGLLCCGSVDAARRAITLATFHDFAREIDVDAFARQREEFAGDSILNMGEWLSSQPYATNRMARLRDFKNSALYGYWEEQLIYSAAQQAPFTPVPRTGTVERADCAGFGRRFGALIIDLIVVASIFALAPHTSTAETTPASANSTERLPGFTNVLLSMVGVVHTQKTVQKNGKATTEQNYNATTIGFPQEFFLYNIVLVALAGQTLGMTILAVRVTTTRFRRAPLLLTLWRYLLSPLGLFSYLLGPLVRIELHDLLSGTRVVRLERTFERAAATPAV